ncbi:MAG: S8 family serine peptidase [Candidatus Gracilibacteria bacterium]
MNRPWLSYIPVTLAVLVAITVGFIDAQNHPATHVFAAESLKQMQSLNYKYRMSVSDLGTSGLSIMPELIKADVLLPGVTAPRENTGLIVTFDDFDGMLLLQPEKKLNDSQLAQVASEYSAGIPEFSNIEPDQEVALESPFYDFGIFAAKESVNLSSTESGVDDAVRVAVVDSGVDETHEIFANTHFGTGWNAIDGDTSMYDDVGHGTHIAGIIATSAPEARIFPYKIVDADGGRLSNVLSALSRAISDEVDVINTSFGLSSSSYALEEMVTRAYEDGIIIVSAAGNSGKDVNFFPASYDKTIAVAGVDAGDHKMTNSNFGDFVDVAAYGYHVRSSLPDNRYGYKSGTSQATAFVSAAVAKMLGASADSSAYDSGTAMTFEEVLSTLQGGTEKIPDGELAGVAVVKVE